MQRKSLRLIAMMLIVFSSLTAKANPVDMRTAREVAMKFVNANAKVPLRGAEDLQLVTTYNISRGDAAFHIFNTSNGFVIVAADDCATPILGYSDEGRPFDLDNVPIQLQGYLQGFVEQIEYGIENNIQPDEATAQQWESVRSIGRLNDDRNGEAVEPLITTQWDQGYPYNSLCPNGYPTGCTATATAQIMNYWQYPNKGIGHNVYSPRSGVGEQSVFFNETYYQWDVMDINHIDAISTLLYHVGVAMNMNYNVTGSGASLASANNALQIYFDYSSSSSMYEKSSYSESVWTALLKNEISSNRPILYDGYNNNNTVGHAWVVDGFDVNNLFHMNFGWSGYGDGYYSTSAQPNGFNSYQKAILGLCPAYSSLKAGFEYACIGPMQYQFVDYSKGDPITFEWSFGDGESSNLLNPVHAFTEPGEYEVTLIVSDDETTDTLTESVQIAYYAFYKTGYEFAPNDPMTPPLILDYDMDGNQDIFVAGYLGHQLFHNDSLDFPSTELPFDYIVNGGMAMEVVDIEKSNMPSIISSAYTPYQSNSLNGFYLSNNNGEMELVTNSFLGIVNNQASFTFGDYDGDGDDDLLLNGLLYQNKGNVGFSKCSNFKYSANKWIDYDGDGDLDMVGSSIYRNDGLGRFVFVYSIVEDTLSNPLVHYRLEFIDMADMDGNGYLDVVMGDIIAFNQDNVSFFRNDYETSYEPGTYIDNRVSIVTDVDCDGDNDIILNRMNGKGCCYINEADGLRCVELYNGSSSGLSSAIDYNGDNVIDLYSCGPWYGDLNENGFNQSNNPPSTPEGLWSEIIGSNVVLHWDGAVDDHSNYPSITYNLMVGTSPNGYDIKSPLSNIETGSRYVCDRGNAGFGTSWKLNNLPSGTYYWRVQAIDNSFSASPFSTEGVFVIEGGNIAPEVVEMCDTVNYGSQYFFDRELFLSHYYDAEGDSLRNIKVSHLPEMGNLYYYGVEVTQEQVFSINEINGLYYETNVFYYDRDTVFFKVSDGFGYSEPIPFYFFLSPADALDLIFVTPNGCGDGSSWSFAIGDLQYAIDYAEVYQSTIWMSAGTYYGDSVSDYAFTIDNDVRIFGGFVGNESSDYDLTNRNFLVNQTIIDGNQSQQIFYGSGTIDGCVLQNGKSRGFHGAIGEGYNYYGWLVKPIYFNKCLIKNAQGPDTFSNCVVSNSIIDGNDYIGVDNVFKNSLITNTKYSHLPSSDYINCIFWNNNFTFNNGATFSYCAFQGQLIDGEGNIVVGNKNTGYSSDTLYLSMMDPENGDYRLSHNSACLNMGMPNVETLGLPSTDMYGNHRIAGGRIDIGPVELDTLPYVSHIISVATDSDISGVAYGEGTYDHGQRITIAAIPYSGFSFTCWTNVDGLIISRSAAYSFYVEEDASFIAHFVENEEICIGSGTETDIDIPTYVNAKYSLSQQIYTAEEIGKTGVVYSVAFFNDGSTTTRNLSIYFSLTNKTQFNDNYDWVTVTESDLVFCGTVAFLSGGYSKVFLTSPFEYDGVSNLVITVDDNSNIYSNCDCPFRVISTEVRQTILKHSYSSDLDPFAPNTFGIRPYKKNQICFEILDSDLKYYTVSTAAVPNEGGLIQGDGVYIENGICTLTALSNWGYAFNAWVKNGRKVSKDLSYSFLVTEDSYLEAYFREISMIQVESSLLQGYNWWAPTIKTRIEDIQTSLGDNLVEIHSKDGIPTGIVTPGEMYMIQVNEPCMLSISGIPITTTTIIFSQDINWFGYTGTEKSVGEVFNSDFTPTEGDKVISQDEGFAVFENGAWHGTLETLQLGKGYVYVSNATEPKTLVIGE